ncbi:Ycf66 family protein [Stenomitos frigidus]|uniref:Ycf66 family protein n=1 Tax=Stenomitos frigidus TaxID=1886765 RepID=UPI001C631FB9|nr:Ycf66 family protein [Stenomitos frigidus]
MLAYILALIVGLSSLGLYMAAFFFPEVHRKNDFIWSGLGLFYALVLWVCAGRITGGVVLGQTASVTLLGWLGWQTLTLRRQLAPVDQQTAIPTPTEWQAALAKAWDGLSRSQAIAPLLKPINKQVAKLTAWAEALVTTTTKPTSAPPTSPDPESYVPLTPADFANAKQDATKAPPTIVTKVAPVTVDDRSQPKESPLAAIASSFKGLTAKRESKPVYVRKQFRAPETKAQTADSQRTIAGDPAEAKASSHIAPESISDETILPETTPEAAAVEVVDATSVEVATEATVSPSITVEAEQVSDAEHASQTEQSP